MSNNAHDLSNRLLNALDNSYNVVDMQAVNEIITILERINITKELLETTRLGKHVNELRRKTSDAALARRAKVLVKRWRDLVIPSGASPGHTGSNRSAGRLVGTPITSPALTRVLSPAVSSSRPPSRPAWGGYESDSMDVIVVDDDPPALPAPVPVPRELTPVALVASPLANSHTPSPLKRLTSPDPRQDDKKVKRDKKLKKRRGHSRAGSGTETSPGATVGAGAPCTPGATVIPGSKVAPGAASALVATNSTGAPAGGPWSSRNGVVHTKRRRNGTLDHYAALVNRIPKTGDKKVKTTIELLEQIQSRGSKPPTSPRSPASPHSPDVILIESDSCPVVVKSPLRNGSSDMKPPSPEVPPSLPLEDEREYQECTCGEEVVHDCPAAPRAIVRPLNVRALHNVYLPGINGTRAPTYPHQFAVRKLTDPEKPGLFSSVVPLYKYSDYADDYCVKNMSKLPFCTHIPWTEFAPPPPDLPPPPSPYPLRPYPIEDMKDEPEEFKEEVSSEDGDAKQEIIKECPKVEAEMVGVPKLEPSERLKAPLLLSEDETQFKKFVLAAEAKHEMEVEEDFETIEQKHRTVEKTKEMNIDGKALYSLCERAIEMVPYDYILVESAPTVTLPEDETEAKEVLEKALSEAETETVRDELGRPPRPENFTEWHECARLGELIALPYVVID